MFLLMDTEVSFRNNKIFFILIEVSQNVCLEDPVDNKLALGQVMAQRRTCDKLLPEPIMIQFTDAYIPFWLTVISYTSYTTRLAHV